nr:MAG: CopG family transcriptional regulator [Candidatus Thorarchaeota archaeon SMTZ1-83]
MPGGLESMRLITVKMSEIYVNGVDRLVELGMYPSRSEAIRVAIRDLLRRELWPAEGSPLSASEASGNSK